MPRFQHHKTRGPGILMGLLILLTPQMIVAQTPPAGLRPPLPAGADWFAQLEYALPYLPGAEAQGVLGDRIERFIANPPKGQELMLIRAENADLFVQELEVLRAEGQMIDSQFNTNLGYRRDILKLPNGKIRAIDSWASPPFFMRMAVATAASEKAALALLGRVERLRAKGGFGGMPILNFPSAPP